ncbi:Bax inhibitor-1/YccA family protein [Bacillus sp. CLL-7-23]|uniref:Bax inhibitor-1/YccA family protein n=1 Tax=Bacillus changyiensis TaxID=3004103 RepID=A0ABT4X2G9_9BACI|nr:Bax inhibitor-1/YccA family protein [Bacillus changyiensis]MDA7026494.1 Bax inhibitor-1/YccA family protein [Bacillus changyiensis]
MIRNRTTSNPALSLNRWENQIGVENDSLMTQSGALQKTGLLFILMFLSFIGTAWYMKTYHLTFSPMIGIMAFIAFLIVIISCFKPQWSPVLAPIYAIAEGIVLGSFTLFNEFMLEAFIITAVIFFTLFILYRAKVLRVSNGFVKLITGLTIGIALFYCIELLLMSLNVASGSLIFGGSWITLGIGVFCLFVAASNLLVDFRMIDDGANEGLPQYMEWYFALGLMISIVWVYVEVLRILRILSRLLNN